MLNHWVVENITLFLFLFVGNGQLHESACVFEAYIHFYFFFLGLINV